MREFKFRAWDKINKRLEEIDGYDLYLASGNVYEVYPDSFGYECAFEKKNVSDRYEIMQYTGIKDKNGKEVYEGDILIHDDANYGYGSEYDKTHDGYLRTVIPGIDVLLNGNWQYDSDQICHWEVIGNIYENPELLEAHHG